MDKLISQQAAIDVVAKWIFEVFGIKESDGTATVFKRLRELPSAQPERPTGEWIQKPRYEDDEYPDAQPNLKCPFCGYEIGWCDMGNYCARCGADLKGGAE